MPEVPALRRLRQRGCKFKDSLSCKARSLLRKVKQKKNPVCLTVGLVTQSCFLMRVSLEECIKCSSQCLNSGFFLILFQCQEHLFSLSANICYYGKRITGNGWRQLIIESRAWKKGASQARAKRRTSLPFEHLQEPSSEEVHIPYHPSVSHQTHTAQLQIDSLESTIISWEKHIYINAQAELTVLNTFIICCQKTV